MQDLKENVKYVKSLSPIVQAADVDTTGVDLQGFDSAAVLVDIGAPGVTYSSSVKVDLILEESDDDATYTAVTANTSVTGGTVGSTGIFQTIDADGECNAVYGIGYVGGKRYIRVALDFTGTHSTGTAMGVTVLLGTPLHAPVTAKANL